LKKYKSQGSDQILAEITGAETLLAAIHKYLNSTCNKEELLHQWKEPNIVPIHKKRKKHSVIIILGCQRHQHHTKFYQAFFSQG
jgi:hypothetical protein